MPIPHTIYSGCLSKLRWCAKKEVRRSIMRKKNPVKGWRPEVDTDGNATKYWDALEKCLHENENLEKTMYDAATAPGIIVGITSRLKPWRSEEIKI